MSVFEKKMPFSTAQLRPSLVYLLILFGSLSVMRFRSAHAADLPGRSWRSLRAGQIEILFDKEDEALARAAESSIRKALEVIETLYGWRLRTELIFVIDDDTDSANGNARVYPYPRIVLHGHPPGMDSTLSGPGGWLDRLVLHEILHVMQMSQVGGIHDWLNHILGPQIYPNQVLPNWFIEGMAVVTESHDGRAGRLHHPLFLGRLRVTALEGQDLPIERITSNPNLPPGGTTPYMFGGAFLDYIRKNHGGHRVLADFVQEYGARFIPGGLNIVIRRLTGKGFSELYREFYAALKKETEIFKAARSRPNEDDLPLIPQMHRMNHLEYLGSRDVLAVVLSDGHERAKITLVDPQSGQRTRERICRGSCDGGISPTAHGRSLLVSTSTPQNVTEVHNDLYEYNLENFQAPPKRWTHGARAKRPDAHRFPQLPVLAVTVDSGISKIVALSGPGKSVRVLRTAKQGQRLDMPRWSNKGTRWVHVLRRDGAYELVIGDYGKGGYATVFRSSWPLIRPVFSRDDRSIFVSTVVDDVYEIVELSLVEDSDRDRVWTQTYGASTQGTPTPHGLCYLSMVGEGWSLRRAKRPRHGPLPRTAVPPKRSTSRGAQPPVTLFPEKSSPAPLLALSRPRYWTPLIAWTNAGRDSLGLSLTGEDPIGHHSWNLSLQSERSEGGVQQLPDLGVGYRYGGWPVDLGLFYVHSAIRRLWFDGSEYQSADARLNYGSVSLWRRFPGLEWTDQAALRVSLVHRSGEKLGRWADPASLKPVWLRPRLQPSLSLIWSHWGGLHTHFGTSSEYGWSTNLSVKYQPAMDSLHPERWRLDWAFVFPLVLSRSAHWVIRNRLQTRLSFSEHEPYEQLSLGGIGPGNVIQQIVDQELTGHDFLRGFAPHQFTGQQSHRWTVDMSVRPWEIFRGVETFPFVLRRLTPALFADFGWIGPYRLERDDLHVGLGVELRLELELGYGFRPVLRAGWAHGLGVEGRPQGYLILSSYP